MIWDFVPSMVRQVDVIEKSDMARETQSLRGRIDSVDREIAQYTAIVADTEQKVADLTVDMENFSNWVNRQLNVVPEMVNQVKKYGRVMNKVEKITEQLRAEMDAVQKAIQPSSDKNLPRQAIAKRKQLIEESGY